MQKKKNEFNIVEQKQTRNYVLQNLDEISSFIE